MITSKIDWELKLSIIETVEIEHQDVVNTCERRAIGDVSTTIPI